MQGLFLQEHKQKLCKTCFCCRKDTWHVEDIVQLSEYIILIVNRFSYMNGKIIKKRSVILQDANIMLGAYKSNLRATVDHRRHMNYAK